MAATGAVGIGSSSGTFYFYAMGDVPGELTCYAYMTPISSITDKVLVRYETASKYSRKVITLNSYQFHNGSNCVTNVTSGI